MYRHPCSQNGIIVSKLCMIEILPKLIFGNDRVFYLSSCNYNQDEEQGYRNKKRFLTDI